VGSGALPAVGDGSVNNAHFLAAVNLAEYSAHRGFKCPVLFGITDNNLSISLRGHNWLTKGFIKKLQMPVFKADVRLPAPARGIPLPAR